ncbi:hypothetical protein GCM10010129_46830 [Streptomyces fumigatiscleroticus]|nr:hypothetical protein GCM10010129_46830 [Streptomyces fumigatiscleroticus]
MHASRLSRRAVLAGTAAATALTATPLLTGRAQATDGAAYPAIYQVGSTEAITAVYRSDDEAKTWTRINDDAHQWGWTGQAVTGDPRVYGRVYLATNGRGIQYGEPV